MDIKSIYHNYLVNKQEKTDKKRNVQSFHASSAGKCYRQQFYSYFNAPKKSFDDKTLRIFRLGTIIHKDFELSIIEYINKNVDKLHEESTTIFTEYGIKIDELNVIGSLDVAQYNNETEILAVYDIKSAAAYTWQKHFGRKENRVTNSNDNYKLQLGTYGLGLKQELQPKKIQLHLFWYNKNTSLVREMLINPDYVSLASEYWEGLNEIFKSLDQQFGIDLEMLLDNNIDIDGIIPEEDYGVPFEEWECRYCAYSDICPSKLSEKTPRQPRKPRTRSRI